MIRKHASLAVSTLALAVLAACGGGSGSDGTMAAPSPVVSAAQVRLQTYITDNLATEYSKVWVSIKQITAIDGSGTEVTLLDATSAPVVVNLSSLAAVGQFMSTVTVPAGLYTRLNVTLGNDVQLVSLDGATTTSARFSATDGDFVWKVRDIEIDTASAGQVVLDFNLARFTYDATSGLVTPVVEVPKPADAFRKFTRQQAEVRGLVQSVDAMAGTVTVNDARLGNGVVVSLATDAVIIDDASGATLGLADLKAGTRLEIKGTVTPGATTADPVTVSASVIHVQPAPSSSVAAAVAARVHGEGTVSAVNGKLVTVKIAEANFLPGTDGVVVDLGNAVFSHGQLSDVVAGVKVEFRGRLSGTGSAAVVAAAAIDVHGAPSKVERQKHPERAFSGVNGAVTQVHADGTFSVRVTRADGPAVAPGTYTVDASAATYTEGGASCLAVGHEVKAVGALTGTTLAARFIDIDNCGGQKRAEPHPGGH